MLINMILVFYIATIMVCFAIILCFARKAVDELEHRQWNMLDTVMLFSFSIVPIINVIFASLCYWGIRKINEGEDLWD